MRQKPVTCDSADYEHTFFGILNRTGQFWTPVAFSDEDAARAHLAKWAIGPNSYMLDTHKIVPVRVRLALVTRTRKPNQPGGIA